MGVFDFLTGQSTGGGYTPPSPDQQGWAAFAQSQLGQPSRYRIPAWQMLAQGMLNGGQAYQNSSTRQAIGNALNAGDAGKTIDMMLQSQDPEMQKLALQTKMQMLVPQWEMAKDAAGNPIAVNKLNPNQSVKVGGNPLVDLNALGDAPASPPAAQTAPPSADSALPPSPSLGLGGATQPPLSMQPPPSAAPALPAQPQKPGIDTGYLNKAKLLSPLAASMAESMINGVFKPESSKGENDPNYVMALQIAKRADPTFNAQSLLGRPDMVKNAASGNLYQQTTNLNAAAQHLYDLHQMAPLTHNGVNSGNAANWIGKHETLLMGGQDANDIRRYNSTVGTAAPEIAKYLGGGQATDAGTSEAAEPYSDNNAPNVIQANAADMYGKMIAKGNSLQNEYDTTMGAAGGGKQVIAPLTKALYADMQGKPLTPEQQQLVNAHRVESNLPPKTWSNRQQQPSPTPIKPGVNGVPLNAKKAPDGNYYIPDSSRPDKYLQVMPNG